MIKTFISYNFYRYIMNSITIGNYTFTLISKTVRDNKVYLSLKFDNMFLEDRDKLYFTSTNNTTGETIDLYAYTSISELCCWRLCFVVPGNEGAINKFNQYIQSTILHLELQRFIYEHYNSLPFTEGEKTGTRRITEDEYERSKETLGDKEPFIYNPDINMNGAINCELPIEEETQEINDRKKLLFDESIWNETFKDQKLYYRFLNLLKIRHNLSLKDIVNRIAEPDGLPYELQLLIASKCSEHIEKYYNQVVYQNRLFRYNGSYENFTFTNTIYEIQLSSTEKSLQPIILHVCNCQIRVQNTEEVKNGYNILNIIPVDTQINKYGLYNEYYDGLTYTSKPLNYIKIVMNGKPDTPISSLQNIRSQNYIFTAYDNENLFPIKNMIVASSDISADEVILDDADILADETYLKIYLKYKQKYLLLKEEFIN